MADTTYFKIEGLEPLLAKMRTLSDKVQHKAAASALRKGGNFVRDKARENFHTLKADDLTTLTDIGSVQQNHIVVRASRKLGRMYGGVAMRIGITGGAVPHNVPGDTGHWRFIEFGRSGVAAKPFMRPAIADHYKDVQKIVTAFMSKSIDGYIKRGAT